MDEQHAGFEEAEVQRIATRVDAGTILRRVEDGLLCWDSRHRVAASAPVDGCHCRLCELALEVRAALGALS